MHLTILSRSSAIYTTRRLVDAGRIAGHRVRVLSPLRCQMLLDGPNASLYYRRKPVTRIDACIPRIGQSIQDYGLAVLDHLARQNIPLVNNAGGISRSRNQIRCLDHLSVRGIPVPATVMASNSQDIKEMVSKVGGCPVLIKLLKGGEGRGVMVCETAQSMEAALEALLALGHNVLVQQYVQASDLRVMVVGGRVVAAVRRAPRVGRVRRTLGAGARFETVRLRPEFAQLAEKTAQLVGLEVAAVDMFDAKDGPKVFEVISSPGVKEMEAVTGVDVAQAIVRHAAKMAQNLAKNK